MDRQDKTATTPEMQRLREIDKVRRALNEMQQATVGSEQEGLACDAAARAVENLKGFHHDASSSGQTPAGEPPAPTTDSWGV